MADQLRRRLTAELTPELERLEALIGRDLTAWKQAREEPSIPVALSA
jgi:hypothetical protein